MKTIIYRLVTNTILSGTISFKQKLLPSIIFSMVLVSYIIYSCGARIRRRPTYLIYIHRIFEGRSLFFVVNILCISDVLLWSLIPFIDHNNYNTSILYGH